MTRQRFRAADPSQGRSLHNDPGVEAASRLSALDLSASDACLAPVGLDLSSKRKMLRAVASRPSKRKCRT